MWLLRGERNAAREDADSGVGEFQRKTQRRMCAAFAMWREVPALAVVQTERRPPVINWMSSTTMAATRRR